MAKETCDQCAFYDRLAATWGECRRRPPQSFVRFPEHPKGLLDEEPLRISIYPEVSVDEWCGEFSPEG